MENVEKFFLAPDESKMTFGKVIFLSGWTGEISMTLLIKYFNDKTS